MSSTKVIYQIQGKESEVTLEQGVTLLEGALIHRLNPTYSCLEGICSQCEATIISGEVEVIPGFETEDHPKKVKTCQTFPKSSPVIVKYNLD